MSNQDHESRVKTSDLIQELRFAKQQQWYVASALVTLLAGIFSVAKAFHPLGTLEMVLATLVAAAVGSYGAVLLWRLQQHLKSTRLRLDLTDQTAFQRGTDVLAALVAIVALGTIVVIYSLWRG
jgi:hypothetical protein